MAMAYKSDKIYSKTFFLQEVLTIFTRIWAFPVPTAFHNV